MTKSFEKFGSKSAFFGFARFGNMKFIVQNRERVCGCVCVCVRERERERERACAKGRERTNVREYE